MVYTWLLFVVVQLQCSYGSIGLLRDTEYTLSKNTHHGFSCSPTTPGNFDFYVMSVSSQPEFCYQHRKEKYPGCENPNDLWRSSLTIHGIWPQSYNGSWPCTCSKENFNLQTLTDVGESLFDLYWPNVKASRDSHHYTGFWEHEWSKHGTCSGLSQDNYFEMALTHVLPTPAIVKDNYGMSLSKSDLLKGYNSSDVNDINTMDVVLICTGKRFLSEIRICLAKNPDGTVSHRIHCPVQVQKESNCGMDISIAKFYVDTKSVESYTPKIGSLQDITL